MERMMQNETNDPDGENDPNQANDLNKDNYLNKTVGREFYKIFKPDFNKFTHFKQS